MRRREAILIVVVLFGTMLLGYIGWQFGLGG